LGSELVEEDPHDVDWDASDSNEVGGVLELVLGKLFEWSGLVREEFLSIQKDYP
jgi:hypothetical protein